MLSILTSETSLVDKQHMAPCGHNIVELRYNPRNDVERYGCVLGGRSRFTALMAAESGAIFVGPAGSPFSLRI
jgi:hypothetical protein